MVLPTSVLNGIDTSTKQLAIFYELAKAGIIKFDLNNPIHKGYYEAFIKKAISYKKEDYENESEFIQLTAENNHMMYCLIINQLVKYAIPENNEKVED